MDLRTYEREQTEEIRQLFRKTFSASEGEDEGLVVSSLAEALLSRTDPEELYCFTALEGQEIIGCIIFSVLGFDQEIPAYLLSPVAVCPEHQGRGIGQQLIRYGLEVLREEGTKLVCTYGDIAFYAKVGFMQVDVQQIPSPFPLSYPHGWLAQSLSGGKLPSMTGTSRCVEALSRPEYW